MRRAPKEKRVTQALSKQIAIGRVARPHNYPSIVVIVIHTIRGYILVNNSSWLLQPTLPVRNKNGQCLSDL